MIKKLRRQAGDTIIEVTIATAILSSIIAAVYTTSTVSYRLEVASREHSEATVLLQEQFEQIQSLRDGYISLGSGGWDTFRTAIFGAAVPRCSDTTNYTIHLDGTKDDATHTITWAVVPATGVATTAQATYRIAVDACYMDDIPTDRIRFNASTDWEGSGGSTQHNEASLELTNVNDIKPLGVIDWVLDRAIGEVAITSLGKNRVVI